MFVHILFEHLLQADAFDHDLNIARDNLDTLFYTRIRRGSRKGHVAPNEKNVFLGGWGCRGPDNMASGKLRYCYILSDLKNHYV